MIRVSVTWGELTVEMDFESDHYSGEVVDDLATRACTTVLALTAHIRAHQQSQ